MKPISTPQFRVRSDGVKFTAPPSAHRFLLSNTRFVDEKLIAQITYTLDDQDISFLKRCKTWLPSLSSSGNSNNRSRILNENDDENENDPKEVVFSPKTLVAIMTAFEIAAYRELHNQDSKYQSQLQEFRLQQQQQQQAQLTTNSSTLTSSRTSATHGALEHTSTIVSSPNLPGILENVTIDLPLVLKGAGIVLFPSTYQNQPQQQQQILDRILDSSKGHWLEKRKASGTALLPVLRPVPYGSGIFGNKQLGEFDEPFTSREVRNCQVLWRNSNSVLPTMAATASLSEDEKERIVAKRRQQQAKHDRRMSKKILNSAFSLLQGIVEREEKRLSHAELLVAELAITRKCRQVGQQQSSCCSNLLTSEDAASPSNVQPQDEYLRMSLGAPLVDVGPCGEFREKYVGHMLTKNASSKKADATVSDDSANFVIQASSLPIQSKERDAIRIVLEDNLLVQDDDNEDEDDE